MATTTVAINLEAKTKGTDSVKSLKAQIREATQEATALAQKFGEFSPEATRAAQRVAELKDQMQDFQQRVQALNPDKFEAVGKIVGGVASGISAAQGAMALFGAESEDVQKALLKVQGAMALAQGIQGVIDAQKQFKAFGQVALSAFQSMTTASKVFLATGLGLLLAALGTVAAYWDDITVALGFAKSEMEKMNDQINIAGQATRTQANDLNFYNSVVQDTTKSEAERKFALEKLKEAGIETNDINLDNADSMKTLTDRTKENILVIAQRARTEAAAQILQEKTKRLLELQNSDLNEQTSAWDNFYAGAVGALMGIDKGAQELGKRGLKNLQTAQQEVTQAQGLYDKQLKAGFPNEAKALENQEKAKTAIEKRKKAQEDAAKAAEKAAQDEKARQAELAKRSEQLILDAELVGKTEVERAEILAKRKFTASVKGFKEGSKEYLAAEKLFNDEVRIAQEKAATEEKSRKEKEQADAIKATDDYYKKQQTALIGNNEALAQLEIERLQAQIDNAKQFGQSTVDLELQLAQKKKEIYDADKKAKEDSEKAKQEAQMATLNEAANAIGALGGILKEGSDAAKAAALLDIAIKTGVGFAQGLDIAQKGAAATGPAAPYAFPIFYAQQIAAVLGAMSRAKAILKGGSGGAGGGGGMGAVGAAPSPMTPLTGGALPEEGQFGGMGRVYVLEGDITKTQTRVRRLRNTSVV
jgi:hypothetical protein